MKFGNKLEKHGFWESFMKSICGLSERCRFVMFKTTLTPTPCYETSLETPAVLSLGTQPSPDFALSFAVFRCRYRVKPAETNCTTRSLLLIPFSCASSSYKAISPSGVEGKLLVFGGNLFSETSAAALLKDRYAVHAIPTVDTNG